MTPIARPRGLAACLLLVAGLISVGLAANHSRMVVVAAAGLCAVAPTVVLLDRLAVAWVKLLAGLLLLIWFIPIRRYAFPINLPFQLEPYRLAAGALFIVWGVALLSDPRTRLRSMRFGAPLGLVCAATLLSVAANGSRVAAPGVTTDVIKALTFFMSFVLAVVCIRSLLDRRGAETMIRVFVVGAAIVGAATVVEARLKFNVFDHLTVVMPFLRHVSSLDVAADPNQFARSQYGRAYASAEHPIALGAALALALPLAIYMIGTTQHKKRWGFAASLILLGLLGSVSRTPITMLLAIVVIYAVMRPRRVLKLSPLILPGLVFIHLALPTTLGTLKSSFFPSGGLIASQQTSKGSIGQGRLADIGPALKVIGRDPLFGEGYATRKVDVHSSDPLAILDDQWLGIALGTGLLGLAAWILLFVRFIGGCLRRGRVRDRTGSLATALGASTVAAAVGMLTFDAFAFVQWTFLLFVIFAIGSIVLDQDEDALPASGRDVRLRDAPPVAS